jgi:single-stranded DNA-binding protein
MAMKKIKDAVYSGEKYTDREGNEKTRHINIGGLFERDDGSLTAKIESIPVGFNGWVNFYEPRAKDGEQPQRRERPQRGATPAPANDPGGFEDDDIPF